VKWGYGARPLYFHVATIDISVWKRKLRRRVLNIYKRSSTSSARSRIAPPAQSGMGIVIGSLLGLALLGWILSFLGIIPGLDQLANYIRTLMEQK
jgi:predicted lipid-binding transport protein (Tim44 family)